LKRFDAFVQQNAAKDAAEKKRAATDAKSALEAAGINVGLDASLGQEIEALDAAVLEEIRAFDANLATRYTGMIAGAKTNIWESIPLIGNDPTAKLSALAKAAMSRAEDLEKAADGAKRDALEKERQELAAREALSPSVEAVVAHIERMVALAKLEACKAGLKTRGISDKSKTLASEAVTTALKNSLNDEFKVLGIGHIRTKLNERSDHGKMKHKLILDIPTGKDLSEILSEGEQRSIAIGSFLAELQQANHRGAIVFDDPVSSLDHWRRQKVAERLVAEAKHRQVIIFTHDTVFLGELGDAIGTTGVASAVYHLENRSDIPGYVEAGLPWEHMSYKERVDMLKKSQRALKARPWPAYPSADDVADMVHEYSLLRATIERVIQDVIFNGVVKRYRDWIKVGELRGVVGFTEAEYSEIDRLHKKCCDFVDAHDPSSGRQTTPPTADEYGDDIVALEAVIAVTLARRKALVAAAQGSKGAMIP